MHTDTTSSAAYLLRRREMAYFMLIFILSRLILANSKPPTAILLLSADLQANLRLDPVAISLAATDYGHMVNHPPAAVLRPSSAHDISVLVKSSHASPLPFTVAARGHGHSVRGQAMASGGVVVDMTALNGNGVGLVKFPHSSGTVYADVSGGMLWIEVLHATLAHGLSPASWTDYLYLTVGGTLSVAGISGQSFRHGPQLTIVHELDVITGTGEMVTCSSHENSELFYGVLGGLGQFGIITRARIVLHTAPKRVKWVRLLYSDFASFTRDQEALISTNQNDVVSLDYLEGSLLLPQAQPNNWRSSFFPTSDHAAIMSLVSQHDVIYCLEVAKFYDQAPVDKELEVLFRGLDFVRGFVYEKDVSYEDFLNRVQSGEQKLKSQGLWDIPHPWLNLFVPRSGILNFNSGVFKNIVLKNNITTGPVLVYPMLRNKWDERTSAVIPDDGDDVFYTVGFLHSGGFDEYEALDEQNRQVLEFCEYEEIKVKQYIPHYSTKQEWIKHFGSKWNKFQEQKARFDPKMILAPGQRIFNNNDD